MLAPSPVAHVRARLRTVTLDPCLSDLAVRLLLHLSLLADHTGFYRSSLASVARKLNRGERSRAFETAVRQLRERGYIQPVRVHDEEGRSSLRWQVQVDLTRWRSLPEELPAEGGVPARTEPVHTARTEPRRKYCTRGMVEGGGRDGREPRERRTGKVRAPVPSPPPPASPPSRPAEPAPGPEDPRVRLIQAVREHSGAIARATVAPAELECAGRLLAEVDLAELVQLLAIAADDRWFGGKVATVFYLAEHLDTISAECRRRRREISTKNVEPTTDPDAINAAVALSADRHERWREAFNSKKAELLAIAVDPREADRRAEAHADRTVAR